MSFSFSTTAHTPDRTAYEVSDAAVAVDYLRLDVEQYPDADLTEEDRSTRARTRELIIAAGELAHGLTNRLGYPAVVVNVSGHAEADAERRSAETLNVGVRSATPDEIADLEAENSDEG